MSFFIRLEGKLKHHTLGKPKWIGQFAIFINCHNFVIRILLGIQKLSVTLSPKTLATYENTCCR